MEPQQGGRLVPEPLSMVRIGLRIDKHAEDSLRELT